VRCFTFKLIAFVSKKIYLALEHRSGSSLSCLQSEPSKVLREFHEQHTQQYASKTLASDRVKHFHWRPIPTSVVVFIG
jgi:hypothetical protein